MVADKFCMMCSHAPAHAKLCRRKIEMSLGAQSRDDTPQAAGTPSAKRISARRWVRMREKGGKLHDMPCNHNAEAFLHAYIDGTGIAGDAKGALFRTVGRDGKLTGNLLHREEQ
jgi:hypothetical protein